MVARMIRWPWPPVMSKKFTVRLVVRGMEGMSSDAPATTAAAEVRWKGPKVALSSLRRAGKKNRTREEEMKEGQAAVEWNEVFECVCTLTTHRENAFHPWEITFVVLSCLKSGSKSKENVVGMASLNLGEFACTTEDVTEIHLPLFAAGHNAEIHPSLHITLSMLELRTTQESADVLEMTALPTSVAHQPGDSVPSEKDELSALRASLRKVKILKDFVSTRKSKKCRDYDSSQDKTSPKSDDAECSCPFDVDSNGDDHDEGDLDDGKEDPTVRKSFNYGSLASTNYIGCSFSSDLRIDEEYEDWVYSHRRSDVGYLHIEEMPPSIPEQSQPILQPSRRIILPWKKRKLSFRSPKPRGEPLLRKEYGEEGGDDIDYDRRLLSSSDESLSEERNKSDIYNSTNATSTSDFGDDNFVIGNWESQEIVSRDGHMKLFAQVFFASIDQRSEQAAGESACTALVAVIADWFQRNRVTMPSKSEFDSLIREGSLEWRNLCENQTYRERFPDKHFDLETILQAKIRRLSIDPRKSFIGFFRPEGDDDNSDFDFLDGAMSFDCIWDEIKQAASDCPTDGSHQLYIVSWNDHFFILKVECDAYYIIDTLGERLYEGYNQAYILKFDENTTIHKVLCTTRDSKSGAMEPEHSDEFATEESDKGNSIGEGDLVSSGKESCKEYMKNFLAAIPIRELQDDIKKGRISSAPLHHRLQIEFHYTAPSDETSATTVITAAEAIPEFPKPMEAAAAFTTLTRLVVV